MVPRPHPLARPDWCVPPSAHVRPRLRRAAGRLRRAMSDFSADQKRYLEGLAAGVSVARATGGLARAGAAASEPTGPDVIHVKAQDKTVAAGGKLAEQEKWKRAEHPFDAYARLSGEAGESKFPQPEDNFRWRYHGLFYVAPAQNSFMCRLRIPNGILNHWQFAGLADLADRYG